MRFRRGDDLNRQELYFKNCKPAMIQSRKKGSKIHAEGSSISRKVRQFAADFMPNVGFTPAFAAA